MATNRDEQGVQEIQDAICRVALSLDSFLLNGIPYGVFHQDVFGGFLDKVATTLLTELAKLEGYAPDAPASSRPKVGELLHGLREKCQQLIDIVTGLGPFKTMPLEEVRATVSKVPRFREECVQLIQELEACLRTPRPFYSSRPSNSTASINDFLANLERMFADEWAASKVKAGNKR